MGVESYVNVYSTDDIKGSGSSSSPVKIIDGRVAVHSIVCIPVGATSANFSDETEAVENRCY